MGELTSLSRRSDGALVIVGRSAICGVPLPDPASCSHPCLPGAVFFSFLGLDSDLLTFCFDEISELTKQAQSPVWARLSRLLVVRHRHSIIHVTRVSVRSQSEVSSRIRVLTRRVPQMRKVLLSRRDTL